MFCLIRIMVRAIAVGFSLLTVLPATAQHTVKLSYVTEPTGSESDFGINVTLDPANLDIVSFRLAIGYNSSLGALIGITDNTGQPQANVEYIPRAEKPLVGIGYADVYRGIFMSTSSDLLEPVNLAQLNFRTSQTYSHSQNHFPVYLTNLNSLEGGDGGLRINLDGTFVWLNTGVEYESLEPTSLISDWAIY